MIKEAVNPNPNPMNPNEIEVIDFEVVVPKPTSQP
jgi:hypothetical protein